MCGYRYLNRERMCVCSVRVAAALRRGVDLVGLPVAVPAAHTVWVWCGFPLGSFTVAPQLWEDVPPMTSPASAARFRAAFRSRSSIVPTSGPRRRRRASVRACLSLGGARSCRTPPRSRPRPPEGRGAHTTSSHARPAPQDPAAFDNQHSQTPNNCEPRHNAREFGGPGSHSLDSRPAIGGGWLG